MNFRLYPKLCLAFFAIAAIVLASVQVGAVATSQSVASLNEKAHQLIVKGELTRAYELVSRALELAQQQQDDLGLARALSNKGSVMYLLGRMEDAIANYQQSLQLAEKQADYDAIDRAINNLANVYNAIGDYAQALQLRLSLLPSTERDGDQLHRASMYISVAASYRLNGKSEQAIPFLDKAAAIFEKTPHAFYQIFWLKEWANISRDRGQYEDAIKYIESGLKLAHKIDNRFQIAALNNLMAEVLYAQGRYQDAAHSARMCLREKSIETTALLRRDCLEQQALALQQAKQYKEALQTTIDLAELSAQISSSKARQFAAITAIEMGVKETELKLARTQRQKQQVELELAEQQRRFLLLAAATVLILLLISFAVYRRNTIRKLELEREKNLELMKLDKLKDRILANTSHELRTPLNGIIGLTEYLLLSDNELTDEERRNSLQLIKRSGEQLADIVDDILDLASLRAGRMKFKREHFDIRTLVEEKYELLYPLAQKKQIQLTLDMPATPITIYSDKKRLGQVIVNLLGNAIKFTERGNVNLSLSVDNSQCQICVADTGIGIAEEFHERVFYGFEQVDAGDSRQFTGSGLGLAICREIIEHLQGTVALESKLGMGTRITVRLPLDEKRPN